MNDKTHKDIIFSLIKKECKRQKQEIGLIPSENHISEQVSEILSSCLSSKYSEGYAGSRYYEGNRIIDQIEELAIKRMRKLFNVPFANVQPYSGSPANAAILFSLLQPGEKFLGMALKSGGHLTHGHPKVTFSGKYYESIQYGLNEDNKVDFDEVRRLAKKHKPKVIVCGTTAYPFYLDFEKFSKIADEIGAWLVADISHIAGLVVGEQHPSPVPWAHIIMTTTHKTLRGPRGAVIMATSKALVKDPAIGTKINKAIIPGLQGGPHNATTAAIALAAQEAYTSQFKKYSEQIIKNSQALAKALKKNNFKLVGNGTETHLMLIDLTDLGPGMGTIAAYALDLAGIYLNRNTIPKDPGSAFYPSGLRIGTPLITTRGMKTKHMTKIANWIRQVVDIIAEYQLGTDKKQWSKQIQKQKKELQKSKKIKEIKKQVNDFANKFPLFTWD